MTDTQKNQAGGHKAADQYAQGRQRQDGRQPAFQNLRLDMPCRFKNQYRQNDKKHDVFEVMGPDTGVEINIAYAKPRQKPTKQACQRQFKF